LPVLVLKAATSFRYRQHIGNSLPFFRFIVAN